MLFLVLEGSLLVRLPTLDLYLIGTNTVDVTFTHLNTNLQPPHSLQRITVGYTNTPLRPVARQ
jgi:hypothetical protein